jgi:toxin YoeB
VFDFDLRWDPNALAEYAHWQKYDRGKAKRVDMLLNSMSEDGPFKGLGKPEPLKWGLHGCWSRRIDERHRLIYEVSGDTVCIRFCGEHYG